MTVTSFAPRRRRVLLLLSLLAAIALLGILIAVAAAQPSTVLSITDLVPANGSTVPSDQEVALSAFVTSDSPITSVAAFIDGSQINVQEVVGSGAVRAGFNATQTFTPGPHTMRVEATNVDGETNAAESTFTAVPGAATAPSDGAEATTPAGGATTATPTAEVMTAPSASPPTSPSATATTVVSASPTTTAAPLAPQQLPPTGSNPAELLISLLLGLGLMVVALGLRLRGRYSKLS